MKTFYLIFNTCEKIHFYTLSYKFIRRNWKQLRLTFMFKVVEGLMPAIPSSVYFEPVPNKRRIRVTRFSDFESTNIVSSHELNK